jgi:hypothetical protein
MPAEDLGLHCAVRRDVGASPRSMTMSKECHARDVTTTATSRRSLCRRRMNPLSAAPYGEVDPVDCGVTLVRSEGRVHVTNQVAK